jgi:hypothetical protein
MPLTTSGMKVLKNMQGKYGNKEGEAVFYATINKGRGGSQKWHKASSKSRIASLKSYKPKKMEV